MKLFSLIILFVLLTPSLTAQHNYTEQEVVEYAKTLDIRKLDHRLPSEPLDKWLRSGPPHLDTVIWQMSRDCDLNDPESETTNSAIANDDDRPLCVRFGFGRRGIGDLVRWKMNRDCILDPAAGESPKNSSVPCQKYSLGQGDGTGSGGDGWGLIAVGTRGKGITGRPSLRDLAVGAPVGGYSEADLADVPQLLRKISALTNDEKKMLNYARTLDVQKLDRTLPSQSFEDWLRSGPAHIEAVDWRVSLDCDLKDPEFEFPNPADWPICVQFDFARGDVGEFALMIIGTRGKGISGSPRLDDLTVSDIPWILDRLDAKKKAVAYVKSIEVIKLDPTLSSEGLDAWLHFGPAHLNHVRWEAARHCDLKPSGSTPENVWRFCVNFTFWRSGAGGSGMIAVAMRGKDLSEPPHLEYIEIPGGTEPARRSMKLSDLPRFLDAVSSQANR
jgi:hypothetical protein